MSFSRAFQWYHSHLDPIWPDGIFKTSKTRDSEKGNKKSVKTRGRILGRNWDKSLESFPPCYSQSPLVTVPPTLSKSGLKLVCNVTLYPESLRTLKIMPRNLNDIVRSCIQLQDRRGGGWQRECRLYGITKRFTHENDVLWERERVKGHIGCTLLRAWSQQLHVLIQLRLYKSIITTIILHFDTDHDNSIIWMRVSKNHLPPHLQR